jgi:hypothetical protein
MAMGIVGGFNIFAGIMSTLQNFLRYAELMEGHRSSSVSWSKFSRNITVELALDEKRRKPAGDFLKICRAEFDRLIEQSPSIDDIIIKHFDKQFKENDIIRPEICNGLKKCKIYKPSEEDKLTHIMANAGNILAKKKHMKTAKSWKRLDVKGNNNNIKIDMEAPIPLPPITENNENKKPSDKPDKVDKPSDNSEISSFLDGIIDDVEKGQ